MLLDNITNMSYTEEKLYKEIFFYTIEEPNEIFMNFFSLKSRCKNCKYTFFLKSLLHKHFKSSCADLNQPNNSTSTPTTELALFIRSTAVAITIGSGYTFKG